MPGPVVPLLKLLSVPGAGGLYLWTAYPMQDAYKPRVSALSRQGVREGSSVSQRE
jgi:hypothetical protein